MTQEERLELIFSEIGKTYRQIAIDLGYSRPQTISDNLKPGKSSTKFVTTVSLAYGYNPEWVLTGNGPKRMKDAEASIIEPTDNETIVTKAGMQFIPNRDGSYTMMTPHITEYGYGGYLNGFSDEVYINEMPVFPVVVGEVHRGVYRSITMKGDSMDDGSRDSIASGDVVTGRLIQRHLWENSRLHFRKNRFFIIHHINGIIVKEIVEHDVPRKRIKIHSVNPDKEAYPDIWIELSQVIEIFNVTHKSQKMI